MNFEELRSSDILLDLGVAVPYRSPGFFLKKKERHIKIYRPHAGSLVRIIKKYHEIGVTFDELAGMSYEQSLAFIEQNSKKVSELVAFALIRGFFLGKLLNKPVAWWLRWRVHPIMLSETMYQLLKLIDLKSFQSIIRSAEMMNIVRPRLSH